MRVSYPLPSRPTKDGTKMAVSLLQYPTDIYVGTVSRPGAPVEGVRRLTLDSRDDDLPAWTRDDRTLLFSSNRNGTFDLYEQDVDSTNATSLVSSSGEQAGARASSDDRWLLYWDYSQIYDPEGEASLRRMPRRGGPGSELLRTNGACSFRLASDGAWGLLLESHGDSAIVSAFEPETGRGASLARLRLPHWTAWDASPDGRRMAWATAPDTSVRIRLYDLVSRTWSSVPVRDLIGIQGIVWAPQGVGWYVYGPASGGWLVLYVHPDGKCDRILPPVPWMRGLAVSPNGRRLAFARNTVQSNAWVFEGL
jgi:Tol biopolymer transport system component